MQKASVLALLLLAVGCSRDGIEVEGYASFEQHVANNRVGGDPDHWIEMRNIAGEWERTGLIFGYAGDYEECQKAIAGLKEVNYEREYRCVPAN